MLVSYQLRLPSGVIEEPMGKSPVGRILYLKSGQMSAQIMGSEIQLLVNTDPRDASPGEA